MTKRKVDARELVRKIEQVTRERMARERVVPLQEYKNLRQATEPRTLLVIEDDETMRKALRRIFEDEGHKVIAAADGTQLSTVLHNEVIDLIILDVGLPWINGFELAQLMKEHDDLKALPLIFVSGRVSQDDIKRGFAAGADDYITKPFDIEQIKKSVKTLMNLHDR